MAAETGELMLQFAVVIVVAKGFAELAGRNDQPEVLGELMAGIFLGLYAWIDPENQFFLVLAEIGAALLLFEVGLETDLKSLLKVGKASGIVAFLGVILPFFLGFFSGYVLGESLIVSLFLGATFTATSVGISIRVLAGLKMIGTDMARTVLGAAVIDDVLGLFILTIVVGMESGKGISLFSLAEQTFIVIVFLATFVWIGLLVVSRLFSQVSKMQARRALLIFAIGLALFSAFLAEEVVGLAPIIGAFLAGLVFAESEEKEFIERELAPIADTIVPVFFVFMGLRFDLGALFDLSILALCVVLLVTAVFSKFVGCTAGAIIGGMDLNQAKSVGVCMIPRGEVGLIIAIYGLRAGVFTASIFSATIVMVLGTTLLAPILIKRIVVSRRLEEEEPLFHDLIRLIKAHKARTS